MRKGTLQHSIRDATDKEEIHPRIKEFSSLQFFDENLCLLKIIRYVSETLEKNH